MEKPGASRAFSLCANEQFRSARIRVHARATFACAFVAIKPYGRVMGVFAFRHHTREGPERAHRSPERQKELS
jgi:hypothetical protein